MDNYSAALEWAKTADEITARAMRLNAPGINREEASALILKLQENGIISAPNDEGRRTLLQSE
jgi:hypothetical protein